MARICSFPDCSGAGEHRCYNCGAQFCRDHVRTEGRDVVCLLCEARPGSEPVMAGGKVRILDGGTSVYDSPNISASKVFRFPAGLEVDAIEEVGEFIQVSSGPAKGYILTSAAEPVGDRQPRERRDAVSLNSEGCQLLKGGQYEEAIERFSEALRLSPAFYDAYRNRAEAYRSLGRTALAESDLAAALRLVRRVETRPWHQTWWATAIWICIPFVVWYGIYVFIAKLVWKERGKVAASFIVFLVSFSFGLSESGVFRDSSESLPASSDYEKQVVVLVARQRDIVDKFNTQLTELQNDPNLAGRSFVDAARPIFQEYRTGIVDLKREWAGLEPPSEALEFHSKGAELWDFEIAMTEECLRAETEQELASADVERLDEEQKLIDEYRRLYDELLSQ